MGLRVKPFGLLTGKGLSDSSKQGGSINDYWFDWKTYHPDTEIYKLGERETK